MAGLVPFNKRNSHAVSTGFSDFDNMLDDFFTEGWPFGKSRMGGTFKIDIQENDKDYVVEAELPGAKKDDVSIDYDEGKLKISVKHCDESEEKKKNYIHKERHCSSMSRSVYLENAKSEGISAKMENGVLSIAVPKLDKPDTSKRIPIE